MEPLDRPIVFLEPVRTAPLITVKLLGESWTLEVLAGPGHEPKHPQVWGYEMNIVIDPAQVRIAVRDRTIIGQDGLFYPSDKTSSLTN